MGDQLRRSKRRRPKAKPKADTIYYDEFKDKSLPIYSDKIELNEEERNLLYPNQYEKRYCICQRTEAEAGEQVMIECDLCSNWFHEECIGINAEEMRELETYVCPECSGEPVRPPVKRRAPSSSDIGILLDALAEIEEEKPRKKKPDSKLQTQKVSLHHFTEPHPEFVGCLKNNSHPDPRIGNGSIVGIRESDLEKGFVWTWWGCYRLSASSDGRIQASIDYNIKSPKKEKLSLQRTQPVCSAQLKVLAGTETTLIDSDSHEQIVLKTEQFPTKSTSHTKLAELLGCSSEEIKSTVTSRLKKKPSILL